MGRIKDENWVTIYTGAAGELSNTFGSSSGTTAWLDARGASGVIFQASSIALGALSKIRVTPKFRAQDGTITYAQNSDGSPSYQEISAINRQPKPFPCDGFELSAEPWLSAADGAAAITIQAKRVYDKDFGAHDNQPALLDADGHAQVDVLTSGLPAGAATEATLALVKTAVHNSGAPLHGQKTVTVAGTEEPLAADQAITSGKPVQIKALQTNTGIVYVGANGVSSADGFQLYPGEPVGLSVTNLNLIYLDVDTGGEGVTWIVES